MWFIPVVLYIMAAVIFYDTGRPVQFWGCLCGAVSLLALHEVIRRRTMRSMSARLLKAREERIQAGASDEEITRFEENTRIEPRPEDVDKALVPIGFLHMVVSFVGIGMLAWGFILLF